MALLKTKISSKLHSKPSLFVLLLLLGFGASIELRVGIGGSDILTSTIAGLAFAGCLASLAILSGTRFDISSRAIIIGLLGGAFLCLPSIIAHFGTPEARPAGSYVLWATVVSIVAISEEAFLRGALFDAVHKWQNTAAALVLTSVAFTLLHVPMYGWHVVPLDLAAGVWLGVLRITSGSFTASAIAHVMADLAGWWLR